jgi:hypothetical protein
MTDTHRYLLDYFTFVAKFFSSQTCSSCSLLCRVSLSSSAKPVFRPRPRYHYRLSEFNFDFSWLQPEGFPRQPLIGALDDVALKLFFG